MIIGEDVADAGQMNKRSYAKPIAALVGRCVADACKRQGFATSEIVTRWGTIVGPEIANCAEPIGMKWIRATDAANAASATLVLRVEGPAAIEIQHQAATIIERVNRYVGWQAVGRLALRQAPLIRRQGRPARRATNEALAQAIAASTGIADERLRQAIGRTRGGHQRDVNRRMIPKSCRRFGQDHVQIKAIASQAIHAERIRFQAGVPPRHCLAAPKAVRMMGMFLFDGAKATVHNGVPQ